MSSEQILTLRQILDNLNLIEPIYSQIVDKVVKSKTENLSNIIIPSAIYVTKKVFEEDYLSGDLDDNENKEYLERFIKEVVVNKILYESPSLVLHEFLVATSKISSLCKLNFVTEDLNYKLEYYHFMHQHLEIWQKIYLKYFEKKVNHEKFFLFVWLLFCVNKKILLKRKNELVHTSCLLGTIVEECAIKLNVSPSVDAKCYSNEILIYLNVNRSMQSRLEVRDPVIGQLEEFVSSPGLELNLPKLQERYYKLLISDEIDDVLIFENFLINSKYKYTPVKRGTMSLNTFKKLTSSYSTNSTENSSSKFFAIEGFNMTPPSNSLNDKMVLDIFMSELKDYLYYDISFLFKKFAKFDSNNKTFYFISFYEEFYSNFIYEKIKIDIEISFNMQKNIFLKLIEQLMQQEKVRFSVMDFNFVLNDETFYQNFIIVSTFIYFNLLLIENLPLLEEIIYSYLSNLNEYKFFDFVSCFKIISNLSKVELPDSIRIILRKLLNSLITFTLWQGKSFLFVNFLCKRNDSLIRNSSSVLTLQPIIKAVYNYLGSVIYKMSNVIKLDNNEREKVWLAVKYLISVDYKLLKDNFLDNFIIEIFSWVSFDKNKTLIETDVYKRMLKVYREVKKTIAIEIFDRLLHLQIDKKSFDNFYKKFLKVWENINLVECRGYTKRNNGLNTHEYSIFKPKMSFMLYKYDFNTILPTLTSEYSTIFSYSPIPKQNFIHFSNENSADLLGNKRIRALTPTLTSKIIPFSPIKNSTVVPLNPPSAFKKNLNDLFELMKQ